MLKTLFTALWIGVTVANGAVYKADVIIYGGTGAAVIAAVQAKRMGHTAIVLSPDKHLGGLSSGGLGFTDTGDKSVIGGLSRDFYHRVWLHYQKTNAWTWQSKEQYGNKGQGTPAVDAGNRTMWIFEPHVAEGIFEDYATDYGLEIHKSAWLNRTNGVEKKGSTIISITTLSGDRYEGRTFIDATYEGDLMAAAGVDYVVGREGADFYKETWAGVQTNVYQHGHNFSVLKQRISPYKIPGNPSSGVLPLVSTQPPGARGQGDQRVQAYCFRMCLTDHPANRLPFRKPEGYDSSQYELLARVFAAGWNEAFSKFDPVPNRKTDVNNHGPVSTDFIGGNYEYPEAGYEKRRQLITEHMRYQQGLFFFMSTDPAVPAQIRNRMQRWGLSADEFKDNGGWPYQLYIRESRRMVGLYVMTEHELLKRRPTPNPIGMGSYAIDSHNVQRYITPEGWVENEGDIGVSTKGPYQIAYGSLVPKKGQADNLLVPVCASSSHVAYGSIRMEPVFMILGQSAATAAVLAIETKQAVQDVSYTALEARLLKDGQVLSAR